MIEIKAEADMRNEGATISSHIEGTLEEILNEAVAVIESLFRIIKKQSALGHFMLLKALRENPEIFMGESEDDERERFAKMMAEIMSKHIIGKGDLN